MPDTIPFGSPPMASTPAPTPAASTPSSAFIPFGSAPITQPKGGTMSGKTKGMLGNAADMAAEAPNWGMRVGMNIGAAPLQIDLKIANAIKSNKTASKIVSAASSVLVPTPLQHLASMLNLNDPYVKGMDPFNAITPQTTGAIAQGLGANPSGAPVPSLLPDSLAKYTSPISPVTPAGFLQKLGDAATVASLAAGPSVSGAWKTAGLFGATGAAKDLSAGIQDPKQISKDAIWSSIFGLAVGTAGNLMSSLGSSEQLRTGVSGANLDAIQKSDPDLVASYINAAKNHGDSLESLRSKTPVAMMEDAFNSRADILTDKIIPEVGQAVGDAKQALGTSPLVINNSTGPVLAGRDAVNAMYDDINQNVMRMTGYGFGSVTDVEDHLPGLTSPGSSAESSLYQLPGREVQLTSAEENSLSRLQGYLDRLRDKPTAAAASDILSNINEDIGSWDNGKFGESSSRVQGALKYAYGQINSSIRATSPQLAAANDVYSQLMNLKESLAGAAGTDSQSSALMMRRVLSGDKSSSVVPLLDQLDEITAPYREGDNTTLVQHAVLGKWATDMFGSAGTKQLFAEGVAQGNQMSSELSSILGFPARFARQQLDNLFTALAPDPTEYAMSVANGTPMSMNPIIRKLDDLLTGEIKTPGAAQIVDGIQSTLKTMRVTSSNIEDISKALFKTWLLNGLTAPKPAGFPNNGVPGPLVSPPADVPQGQQSMANPSQQSAPVASAARSLTPPSTGQGMASQQRTLGTVAPGMSVSNTNMTV